ncbi:MAG: Cobyrinic acid ac-diamide synthase [Devosia sp.]|uniref:CpsD/CapB family tyrosine-protein kinase n=1 Tax=Devosia sp. TaxID=1871048 RepID=UPI0026145BD5|nr:CpsD/CapB family tyrosine-protein kinase [Devosia sp.]MDB5540756.1 Cobyrinic acid ac-diamide synthase [Devosia sp.]
MTLEDPIRPLREAQLPPRLPPIQSAFKTERAGTQQAWTELRALELDPKQLETNRIVTVARNDPRHMPLDILRTKLVRTMRKNGWSVLAITSPTARCGKSTIALNLAFSLAMQSDLRLALLDFDLRSPSVARLLGCGRHFAIERLLRGQNKMAENMLRHGNNLAVAPNTVPVRDAAELLQDVASGTAIREMRRTLGLDLVILDLPPMLSSDDVMSILPGVDCVLLVAAAELSSLNEIDICEQELSEQGKLLGVVLNKCRLLPEKYGY